MKVYRNEITCYRNESWTFDKVIVARDGAPYCISKRWNNPYVLLTVASTRYDQKDRYIRNWWLDVGSGYEIEDESGEKHTVKVNVFDSTKPIKIEAFDAQILKDKGWNGEDALYYTEDDLGNRIYKRFDDITEVFVDYEFRLIKLFTQPETEEWVEQSYVYSITLVAGQLTNDYLHNLCILHLNELYTEEDGKYYNYYGDEILTPEDAIPVDTISMYNLLYDVNEELVEEINPNQPLVNYSAVQTILGPTKLSVLSDIRGGMHGIY